MYEQLPLWTGFFERLGFEVVLSENASHNLRGRYFYDTACFPARLMCCHIENLLDKGVDFIFLPCERFDFSDSRSINNICPYTAFYPELLLTDNERLGKNNFISPYVNPNEKKRTAVTLYETFKYFGFKKREVFSALNEGFYRLKNYRTSVRDKLHEIFVQAQREGRHSVILAGRPYHLDKEINHGINKLLTSLGFAVLSDDIVARDNQPYSARLFKTAEFIVKHNNVSLIQLTSSGCGFDETISEEVRALLESKGKSYYKIILT